MERSSVLRGLLIPAAFGVDAAALMVLALVADISTRADGAQPGWIVWGLITLTPWFMAAILPICVAWALVSAAVALWGVKAHRRLTFTLLFTVGAAGTVALLLSILMPTIWTPSPFLGASSAVIVVLTTALVAVIAGVAAFPRPAR